MLEIHMVWIEQVMTVALGVLAATGMTLWIWLERIGRMTATDLCAQAGLRRLPGCCNRPERGACGRLAPMPAWSVRAPPELQRP